MSPSVRRLVACRLVRSFAQAVVSVAVPLYLAAAGRSPLEVGQVLSAGSVGALVLVLAVGLAGDRWGRRPILVALALLGAAGTLGFAATVDAWTLSALAAVAAIGRGGGAGSGGGWGPFYPAEQPLVAASVAHAERNRTFAVLSFAGVLGSAAGSGAAALHPLLVRALAVTPLAAFRILFVTAAAASVAVAWLAHRVVEPPRARPARRLTRPARQLIGRLWLTNGLNGLVIGVLGPFLTYWFALRYGVGAGTLGLLYLGVNLAAGVGFLAAPTLALRLGSVRAIATARLAASACFVLMAVAPIFPLAAIAYAGRTVLNGIGMTLRQSFVMGVSDEDSRSLVAAFGNLPAQTTGSATPALGTYLATAVSVEAPLWLAAGAMALNALLYFRIFRHLTPPEERERGRRVA